VREQMVRVYNLLWGGHRNSGKILFWPIITEIGVVHPHSTFHEFPKDPALPDQPNRETKSAKSGQEGIDEPSAEDISVHAELKEHLSLVCGAFRAHLHSTHSLAG